MGMFSINLDTKIADALNERAVDTDDDYKKIISAASGKTFILLGESSHGTAEFYHARAQITKDLILNGLCDAVAVEADWPDAYRVNRYVCGRSDDEDGQEALANFERFPTWMWRNHEVLSFIEWLKSYNQSQSAGYPCSFFGLDLYSMNASIQSVVQYLDRVDPGEGQAARERYSCFARVNNDPQSYGMASASGTLANCEEGAVQQLLELQSKAWLYLEREGEFAGDEYFSAQQNAEIVRQAEQYYRALYRGHPNTWNLRDSHMFKTLERLANYIGLRTERNIRIVVWAHNSHLGNAAATDMGKRGEYNIGQLVKQKYKDQCLSVGFTTSEGTVTAASSWDGPARVKDIRSPLSGSYEELFSRMKKPNFYLDLRNPSVAYALKEERLERAIGVIYRPENERRSHYFHACLPKQFDFVVHLNRTSALEGLPAHALQRPGDLDETYPYGL